MISSSRSRSLLPCTRSTYALPFVSGSGLPKFQMVWHHWRVIGRDCIPLSEVWHLIFVQRSFPIGIWGLGVLNGGPSGCCLATIKQMPRIDVAAGLDQCGTGGVRDSGWQVMGPQRFLRVVPFGRVVARKGWPVRPKGLVFFWPPFEPSSPQGWRSRSRLVLIPFEFNIKSDGPHSA